MAIYDLSAADGYKYTFESISSNSTNVSTNVSLIEIISNSNSPSSAIKIPYTVSANILDTDTGTATGTSAEVSVLQIGNNVDLPDYISSVTVENGISSIGNNSFNDSSSLVYISLPASIKSIGTNTLTYNTGLTGISINGENPKYKSNSNCIYSYINSKYLDLILCPAGLTSIEFSNDVSSISEIGPYAFAGCDKISSVNIPNNVSEINECAFENCTSLAHINIGNNISSISDTAFDRCTSIFIEVSSENSTYSSISGGLYNISGTTFIKCPGIVTSYDIPESVTKIESNAFNDSLNISYINFLGTPPEFEGQLNLINGTYLEKYKEQWLPEIVNNKWHGLIMSSAQQKTENVEFTYIIEKGNAYITGLSNTFNSGKLSIPPSIDNVSIVGIKSYAFANINTLMSITLPPSITNIEPYAFYNCTGLTTVILPRRLNVINNSTFFGCASLTDIELPDTLLSINDNAFYGCVALSKINIPKNVSKINSLVFYGCDKLDNIEFLGKPPLVSYGAFPLTNGTYLDTYKVEWEEVLKDGMWNNLTLTMVEDPNKEPEPGPEPEPEPEPEPKNLINFRIYNKQVIFNDSNNKITNPTVYIAGLVLETDNETGKEHPVKGLFINDNIKLNSYITWESRGILSSMS
jgi:hypothetical protein